VAWRLFVSSVAQNLFVQLESRRQRLKACVGTPELTVFRLLFSTVISVVTGFLMVLAVMKIPYQLHVGCYLATVIFYMSGEVGSTGTGFIRLCDSKFVFVLLVAWPCCCFSHGKFFFVD